MMTDLRKFDAKLESTANVIADALRHAARPVVLSSFGKESLCLLAILEEMGTEIDVAYFELGAIPRAHQFARRFIARRGLPITLLRPHGTHIISGWYGSDLAYRFELENGDSFTIAGATFDDSSPRGVSCGLFSNLTRSGCHEPYQWDLLISGRRRSDVDPTLGSLMINKQEARMAAGTQLLMPLLMWSDEDVAHYLATKDEFAPDFERYELRFGRLVSRTTVQANPDNLPICIRCLSARRGGRVECPLALTRANSEHAIAERVFFDSGKVPATVML